MKIFIKISAVGGAFQEFVELNEFPASLGRDPASSCVLVGEGVSRKHAEIIFEGDSLFVVDSESKNGIYCDSKKTTRIAIQEGLKLQVGALFLEFSFHYFPLEKTGEYLIPESLVNTPLLKKTQPLGDWLDAHATKASVILFLLNLILSLLTAPNHFRKEDLVKQVLSSSLSAALLSPLFLYVLILLFRKLNRGEWAWSLAAAYALLVTFFLQVNELISKSFCWFSTFEIIWEGLVSTVLAMTAFIFLWISAVGKEQTRRVRIQKSFAISILFIGIFFSFRLLSTGYRSDYDLESCYSLTGWSWGQGESLKDWQSWMSQTAKELK